MPKAELKDTECYKLSFTYKWVRDNLKLLESGLDTSRGTLR